MTVITPPAPRRSNGCLWGCLIVLLIFALPALVTGGYGAWFLWQGWKHSPVLRATAEFVNDDGMAQLALGRHIRITGMEGSATSFFSGFGTHSAYRVELEGDKGDGVLDVEADTVGGTVKFRDMILTGPDGTRYDLMHHRAEPSPAPTNSI